VASENVIVCLATLKIALKLSKCQCRHNEIWTTVTVGVSTE